MTSEEIWILAEKRASEIIENIITPGFQPIEIPILKWKTEDDYNWVYGSPGMTYSECNAVNRHIIRNLSMHGYKPMILEATFLDYDMWLANIESENTAENRAAYVAVLYEKEKRNSEK